MIKDMLGNEIKVGDIVACGMESGNSGNLGIAIVVELYGYTYTGNNQTVIVRGIQHSGNWRSNEKGKINQRTNLYTYRAIVLNIDNWTKEMKEMIKEVKNKLELN